MNYTKKYFCRCCRQKDLLLYLDLGSQPLANSYHKGKKLPEIPLEVMLCRNCYHSQLSVVVDPDAMFRNYLYVSGTTETFRKHTKALAEDAVKRIKGKNIQVLDIACNDGSQLEHFRDLGCKIFGVDPAKNLRKITRQKKIPVVVDYWTKSLARSIAKKFDIITATNVFAHVDNVDEFLLASQIALKDDGLLIIEFPYADNMISNNEFDTVYHEHLSYFLVNSFKTLVERLNFHILDVLQTPIHGGSIRFFLQKSSGKHTVKIEKLIKTEKTKRLLNEKSYKTYAEKVKKNKQDMLSLLTKLKSKNKKVIGYGAAAKGNTMLNYFKIDLDYIVDDNELKWGLKTPGRNIPIKNPQVMKEERDKLYIAILSWNFYNEIAKKIVAIRGHVKDYAILYVPKVKLRKI
jgi:2-polyprenyl-3-methyl-5-hydroxy-6-metoxy-1,4-benzoquinol methylase